MRYRSIQRLDWRVSEIGFGAWAIGSDWGLQRDEDSVAALRRAIELGCNFIDTAAAYGKGKSERTIAKVLRECRSSEKIYVATKVAPLMTHDWLPTPYERWDEKYPERHIRDSVDQSLQELQTDRIDLLQMHTWSRAWNRDPVPFHILTDLKRTGKIGAIGVSTPETDQNAVVDLMRAGLVDCVQLIFNVFEQDAQMELLPLAKELGIGVIVRVPFDESALTGKLTAATRFGTADIRASYFAGDRLRRAVERVDKIREAVGTEEPNLAAAALKFSLKPDAVSTVIPGMRNAAQAEQNCLVSDLPSMSDSLEQTLRQHFWRRTFWYAGK